MPGENQGHCFLFSYVSLLYWKRWRGCRYVCLEGMEGQKPENCPGRTSVIATACLSFSTLLNRRDVYLHVHAWKSIETLLSFWILGLLEHVHHCLDLPLDLFWTCPAHLSSGSPCNSQPLDSPLDLLVKLLCFAHRTTFDHLHRQ